jgi:hypothetical protein
MQRESQNSQAESSRKASGDSETPELPLRAGGAELEERLVAEMQTRRERFAEWMELIQEEVRRTGARGRRRPASWHRCRPRDEAFAGRFRTSPR